MRRAVIVRLVGHTLMAFGWLGACCAPAARASNQNPNLVPLGESESFLGNAGVGRANDTGAVYYNPSGLVELGEGRISMSGTVYMSIATHYDAIFHFDNTDIPFDESGFVTIPSAFVATRRFGDWTAAFSVLAPNSFQLNNRLPFSTPNWRGNVVQSTSTSELWIGLSAAHKLGERWSLGVTVFGIDHEDIATLGVDFQQRSTMAFLSGIDQTDFSIIGLSATVGVSYLATDFLRFGLRAQSAMVQLYGKETAYQQTHNTTPNAPAAAPGEDISGPANYSMPFDFTLGTALMPADWFTLLADVSLQLGASYQTFPASSNFNETRKLKPMPRFNLGFEVTAAPAYPVRLGLYYDPSANDGNPGDANFSKEDFYGLTAGVGIDTLAKEFKVRATLGGFYAWSSGHMTPNFATGTSASLSTRAVGVLLTTGYAF